MSKHTITSAQYKRNIDDTENESIILVRTTDAANTKTVVPINSDNTDYQDILDWVAEGNTIADAD